jgi:hypothetical protein
MEYSVAVHKDREPMDQSRAWLSTEEVAARVGMTAEWVRQQVMAGRLNARVYRTGTRTTYRIRDIDVVLFIERWSVSTDEPGWEEAIERSHDPRTSGVGGRGRRDPPATLGGFASTRSTGMFPKRGWLGSG